MGAGEVADPEGLGEGGAGRVEPQTSRGWGERMKPQHFFLHVVMMILILEFVLVKLDNSIRISTQKAMHPYISVK